MKDSGLAAFFAGFVLAILLAVVVGISTTPERGLKTGRVVQTYSQHYATVVSPGGHAVECEITREQAETLKPGQEVRP